MIPYEKGQPVSFIDSPGQTVTLTVTDDVTFWASREDLEDFESIERRMVVLQSELGYYISLYIHGNYNATNGNKISIGLSLYSNGIFDLYCDKNGQFVISEHNDYKQYLYDSLEINGKIYYDVVDRLVGKYRYLENGEYVSGLSMQLFYNKTYGILQIKKDGKNFLMINQ